MTIASKVTRLEAGRVEMLSRFYSHKNNRLSGEGTILVYCFDYNKGKKVDFTPEIISAIKELEADPLKAQELALNTPFRTLSNY
jgi:acyl-CoA thioesterase FadM